MPPRHLLWGGGLAALVLVLDQASKWWIVEHVMRPPRMIEVTGFFNLVLGHNRGVSFGLFHNDADAGRWILSLLALAICAALVVWMWRSREVFVAAALGLIVGGAIGNVVDRMTVGAVVDFLDFHAAGYHWPAFNVADIAITGGAVGLVWDSVFGGKDRG
ncbi:MAG: signal peptidase II [Rhodospirillaceae bacterium]